MKQKATSHPTPGLTETEMELLTPQERDTAPQNIKANFEGELPSQFNRLLSETFLNGNVEPSRETTYWVHETKQLAVDPGVPKMKFEIMRTDSDRPTIELEEIEEGLSPYVEIDISPKFDSHLVLRWPSLATLVSNHNLKSHLGSRLNIAYSTQRLMKYPVKAFEFPIRLHAFALGLLSSEVTFEEYAKFSQALCWGLQSDPEEMLREVFNYAQAHVLQGDDRFMRTGYELFCAGIGGCGNVNNMVGEILEMHGLRYRLVSGFNPVMRTAYPGGGHSAIEVFVDDKWSYLDSYLDVLALGFPAGELKKHERYSQIHVFQVDNEQFPIERFGSEMLLGDLFRYRLFGDLGGRRMTETMFSLGDDIDSFGTDWPLRTLFDSDILNPSSDIPDTQTVYVRARYIRGVNIAFGQQQVSDANVVAGEWNTQSFSFNARELFAR